MDFIKDKVKIKGYEALYILWYDNSLFKANPIGGEGGGNSLYFRLDVPYRVLVEDKNIVKEILTYTRGKVSPDDELTLADIFMHGKYITQIN